MIDILAKLHQNPADLKLFCRSFFASNLLLILTIWGTTTKRIALFLPTTLEIGMNSRELIVPPIDIQDANQLDSSGRLGIPEARGVSVDWSNGSIDEGHATFIPYISAVIFAVVK